MMLRLMDSTLVLGNRDDVHFRSLVDWLDENVSCRYLDSAAAALAIPIDNRELALVVLLQSRPGQVTELELAAMRDRWPLARFVSVAGSWCEGEPRSGAVAKGVYRIAWHAAVDRLAAELGGFSGGPNLPGGGLFGLPATATIDERLAANSTPSSAMPAVVAVAARRVSWAEPVVEALAAAGHAALFWPLDGGSLARGIDAVVWDTFGCEQGLEAFRRVLPAGSGPAASGVMPIVAVADFPRPQDVLKLAKLGVGRVLGKPMLVADLLTCLDELLGAVRTERQQMAAIA